MICPNCNCELVDGTAVCPYCGTPLAAGPAPADATATMPAIQHPAAAPAPAYRAEDVPAAAPAPMPEAPQPAARDNGAQATAYGRLETAAAPAPRDPYEDYYRTAPNRGGQAPQTGRDPYEGYREAPHAGDTDGRGRREETREDVRAEGRDARRQQKLNAKAAKARKRRERAAEKAGKKKGMKRLLPTEDYPGTLVLRADKCTQDALGYELLCEDGTVKLQQGVYSRVVEFQDASFQAARESEQREIYENWSELLNTFDNTVHLQVKILCRVIDRDAFREDAFLPPVEGDYAGNRFRRDINQIIESKVAETQQNVERRRLFIVTVEAPTREQASPLLARATEQVMRSLKNMGSTRRRSAETSFCASSTRSPTRATRAASSRSRT